MDTDPAVMDTITKAIFQKFITLLRHNNSGGEKIGIIICIMLIVLDCLKRKNNFGNSVIRTSDSIFYLFIG